jgi:hypothetical protein
MLVGLNAGGWGPTEPARESGAVSVVRLDADLSANDVSYYTSIGMRVDLDFSGPYQSSGGPDGTGGVRALDATSWAQNALNYYETNCGGSTANCPVIEVLNEVAGSWFWGANASDSANAVAYVNLLKTVYGVFTAKYGSNRPQILASYDTSTGWWARVEAADPNVGDYFDGPVYHAYGGASDPAQSALGSRSEVEQAHTDTGKTVWITEVGWPTAVGQPPTGDSLQWTEPQQADNIYNFVVWARSTGYVGAVMIFGSLDYGTNNWYGVMRYGEGGSTVDFSDKPSFRALYCAAHGLPESC